MDGDEDSEAHQEKDVGLIKKLSGVFDLSFASRLVTYTFRHQIVTMGSLETKNYVS
jgi:hypothetical protein